jgi:hypothetical protein
MFQRLVLVFSATCALVLSAFISSGSASAQTRHPLVPPPKLVLPTPTPRPDTNSVSGGGTQLIAGGNAIDQEYARVASILGPPQGGPGFTAGGAAIYRIYQGGRIYYTPATGAHEVHGSILAKYLDLSGPDGVLGAPTTDQGVTPDGVGRFNHFANNGSIYWTPATGAHEVHGFIRSEFKDVGWEQSPLGYPVTDELPTPDGVGRFNQFQLGWIYWTPGTGAHEVHGAIGNAWASLGWERSYLGYPTADESNWSDPSGNAGRISGFQYGQIGWSTSAGVIQLPETVIHRESVETPSGTALGGFAEVELQSDGVYCYRGGLHDSGVDNYSFVVTGVVIAPDNSIALLLPEAGKVEGTASWAPWHDPQRQFDWPSGRLVQDPNNPLFPQYVPPDPSAACSNSADVRNNWRTLRNASIQIRHEYRSELIDELTGYLQQVVDNYKEELTSAGIGALVALAVA